MNVICRSSKNARIWIYSNHFRWFNDANEVLEIIRLSMNRCFRMFHIVP